ncbi:TetR/AcrR family transcriptional regulator [uncultured Algimonas sp.]|uniref:TetR/AcrR family transcriptional regulator n=1 Tax=uncultured Algimonas sp. TaxID=1547920 RepID=UPI0026056830|nr:TetR/AcrR family transcriptional regulator [uncultured Algimonas sp.]
MTDTAAETIKDRRRGRPAQFDTDRVEAAIADLFWERGYDGVSVSDITAATGLSKSSLYNSFGGKAALFEAALARYHAQTVRTGADWLAAHDGSDPMDKLDRLFSGPADDVHGRNDARGCFLCNTSADGLSGDRKARAPDIDTLVGDGFQILEDGLFALFSRYAPQAGRDRIRDAARLALTTYIGLRIRSRTKPARTEMDAVRNATVQAVRLILK